MLIVTHSTIRNPGILRVRQLPRKFFGRVSVWPKGQRVKGGLLRLLIEFQAIRYLLALLPLIIIALIWNSTALPLSQAPILMIAIIWWVEMRLLRVPPAKRARLADAVTVDRTLDLLAVQARAILTQIAAGRGMRTGVLRLVVEQSDLGMFTPLTYVSVQSQDGPQVLDLTRDEQQIIRDTLFCDGLDETTLHRVNQAQNQFLRDIGFDVRGVSNHDRLAAALAGGAASDRAPVSAS